MRHARFPDHLLRVTTGCEVEGDACVCKNCGGQLHNIGDVAAKQRERLETSIVHEIRRAEYACRGCTNGETTAPGPDRVIKRRVLGLGFLPHVMVEHFGSDVLYNRLEQKYAPEGLEVSRSVLQRSVKGCADWLAPVHFQMRKEIVDGDVLFRDDRARCAPADLARDGCR